MSESEDSEGDWEANIDEGLMDTAKPGDNMDPENPGKSKGTGKSEGDTGNWFGNASSGKSSSDDKSDYDVGYYDYTQLAPVLKIEKDPEKRDPEIEALRKQEEEDIKKAPYIDGNNYLPEHDLGRSTKSSHLALEDAQKKQEEARKKKDAQKKTNDNNVMLRFY